MGAPLYNDSDSDFELAERVRTNQQRLTAAVQPQYDFIVCGAGSSGSLIARRLAEHPDAQVLLLEAGGSDDVPAVWTADLWPTNLGSERDWGFQSEPNAALNGRRFALPMGKVLGGGSSINVMVWQRGHRSDWDHFASESGDAAWKYANILNIYRHIDDWHGEPDPDYRGSGGPVFVQPAPDPHPLAFATLEAARSIGIPTFENANGRIMEAGAGASIADVRVRSDRTRVSVFRSYTYPYMDRPNLTVLTHALVWRLIFDATRVTGVELLYRGQIHRLKASSEVVLSLGAIHTPKVLMQSGIGDEEELRRLGIPVVQHLPGVGGNYQDHIGFNCVWEFYEPPTPSYLAESMVFWGSRPELESPDLFLGEAPAPSASPENAKRFGLPEAGWNFFGGLSRPRSRGHLLRSRRMAGCSARPHLAVGSLLQFRRQFDQYVNLRPVKLMAGVRTPLAGRAPGEVDFLIVRENSEGEYSSIGGKIFEGTERETVIQETVMTRAGVDLNRPGMSTAYSSSPLSRRRGGRASISRRQRRATASRSPCPTGTSASSRWRTHFPMSRSTSITSTS